MLSYLGNRATSPHGMPGRRPRVTCGQPSGSTGAAGKRNGHPASRTPAASRCGRTAFPGLREGLHPAAATNTLFH